VVVERPHYIPERFVEGLGRLGSEKRGQRPGGFVGRPGKLGWEKRDWYPEL